MFAPLQPVGTICHPRLFTSPLYLGAFCRMLASGIWNGSFADFNVPAVEGNRVLR